MKTRVSTSAALAAALLLVGCQSPLLHHETASANAAAATFSGPPAGSAPVYRLVPAASQVTIYAYRAGAAARFGHNHVLTAPRLEGWLAMSGDDAKAATFALRLRLDELQVDDAALRAATGGSFASPRSAEDISGTQKNMLKSLDAQRDPELVIRSLAIDGDWPVWVADIAIGLHGVTRMQRVVLKARREDARVEVSGSFAVRQSDFGIKPFSILGGALAVDDTLAVEFALQLAAAQQE